MAIFPVECDFQTLGALFSSWLWTELVGNESVRFGRVARSGSSSGLFKLLPELRFSVLSGA
jgi:hypothetical protein